VRLQSIECGTWVCIEVADTGPGIWASHRSKLFQIFERLNADAVSGIEGSGLGLALSAKLMELMGGRIGYSDNPGGGSIFRVELPCGAPASVSVEAAAPTSLADRAHLRVLVVDDEAMNRNIASGFLSMAGHDVVCVDNGAAADPRAASPTRCGPHHRRDRPGFRSADRDMPRGGHGRSCLEAVQAGSTARHD
jgi:Histidine kinase-, DNA gyrase B-, and HSP90-like ATPase